MLVLSPRTWSKFKSTTASPNQTSTWTPTRIAQFHLFWHPKMVHWCHLRNRSQNIVTLTMWSRLKYSVYIYTHTPQTKPSHLLSTHSLQDFRLLFSMQLCVLLTVLGLLVTGSGAQGLMPTVSLPPCDSPEAEAAALVAQDFLNDQHTHGYKYVLNQIEEIKIVSRVRHRMIANNTCDGGEQSCQKLLLFTVMWCVRVSNIGFKNVECII